jgi:hypothetical protein
MKRLITIASLLLFATAGAAMAEIHGAWTANLHDDDRGRIQFNLTRRNNNHGNSMKLSDFTGLSEAQVRAGVSTPVRFQLAREAGTVTFEGSFKNGDGAGQFSFTANPGYVNTLRSMGLDLDLKGDRSDEEDLFSVALLDVSTAFIRSIRNEGFDVSLDKYVAMRIFNVTPEYIREMRSLGFRDVDADDLISTRIHKVTPEYIRQMRAAGWDLSLDQLVSSRIHKATPEFAEEMRKLGYGSLDHDDLIAFRIHGVTAKFISELRELGYDNVKADKLVAMRIHRVTPDYIRQLKAAGYSGIPVDKLISMRIHNVDVKFIEKMNKVD